MRLIGLGSIWRDLDGLGGFRMQMHLNGFGQIERDLEGFRSI